MSWRCVHFFNVGVHNLLQAVAGLAADGRQIVARAKSEATSYERLVHVCFIFSVPLKPI